jgi:uncharacterized membrane protein
MAKIDKHIDINATGEEVFGVLTDLDLLPSWSTITVETHGTPPKPVSEGDTFEQSLRVLGRSMESSWRVTEFSSPRKVAYETTAVGGGTLRMVQTVEDSAGNSRVMMELDYELPGGIVGELFDSAYAERRNERELEHSLHNLKEFIEGRSGSDAG